MPSCVFHLQTRELNSDNEELTAALDVFLPKLVMASSGLSLPMRMILDDPSGNSFVENPVAPKVCPLRLR